MGIKKVNNKADFIKKEHRILDFWKRNKIFDKRSKKNKRETTSNKNKITTIMRNKKKISPGGKRKSIINLPRIFSFFFLIYNRFTSCVSSAATHSAKNEFFQISNLGKVLRLIKISLNFESTFSGIICFNKS